MQQLILLISAISILTLACNSSATTGGFGVEPHETTEAGLNWYTIEDLEKMKNISDRKILIDVYTGWCGWCKKMDANTFTDPAVVAYLNENYVLVKFNAEQKESLVFKGTTYETSQIGRRKTNKFAMKILNGRLGYPTIVYFDGSNLEQIKASPGYKTPAQLMSELQNISGTSAS